MEKVTAYKAFNGTLFENEQKCLEYEAKLKAYPKQSEDIEQIAPDFFGKQLPIYKHTIKRKARYNEPTRSRIFYEIRVDGKASYYTIGSDDFERGLSSEAFINTNIQNGVGLVLRNFIINGENPFADGFMDKFQQGIYDWNDGLKDDFKNRKSQIGVRKAEINDNTIAFELELCDCGALPPINAVLTTDKDYIVNKLLKNCK